MSIFQQCALQVPIEGRGQHLLHLTVEFTLRLSLGQQTGDGTGAAQQHRNG
jgi:hypothetical protein